MGSARFGTMPDGRAVTAYTLRSGKGPELTVLDLGATVQRLRSLNVAGELEDIALGYSNVDSYLSDANPYLGATIGRFANRIAGGRFTLDGTTWRLTASEGDTCLHGGAEGFHLRLWTVVDHGADFVEMELISPAGDQGFPGELTARATYRVVADAVHIELSATTDAPTVVSLTNHTYFNLMGEEPGSIDNHLLTVDADTYLPVDNRAIPLGHFEDVATTPFDFTVPTKLASRVRDPHAQIIQGCGIDHAYLVRGVGMRRAARLEYPPTGRFIEISTNQPSLQVYTGNSLNGSLQGLHGRLLRQGDGIALETQRYPDSPNQPAFPAAVLRPGDRYRALTTWRVGRD